MDTEIIELLSVQRAKALEHIATLQKQREEFTIQLEELSMGMEATREAVTRYDRALEIFDPKQTVGPKANSLAGSEDVRSTFTDFRLDPFPNK